MVIPKFCRPVIMGKNNSHLPEAKITEADLKEIIDYYLNEGLRTKKPQSRRSILSFLPSFREYYEIQNIPRKEWKHYHYGDNSYCNFLTKMRRADMLIQFYFKNKKRGTL